MRNFWTLPPTEEEEESSSADRTPGQGDPGFAGPAGFKNPKILKFLNS